MGSKTKTYHVNMLNREPEGNVVPVDDTDGATVAVAGVIHRPAYPQTWYGVQLKLIWGRISSFWGKIFQFLG